MRKDWPLDDAMPPLNRRSIILQILIKFYCNTIATNGPDQFPQQDLHHMPTIASLSYTL